MFESDTFFEDCINGDLTAAVQSGSIRWVANFGLSVQKSDFSASLDFFKQLSIPTISEARKQKAIALYEKWGSYGWTLDPNGALYSLFRTEPMDRNDADNQARKLFRDMAPVFDAIRNCKRAKISDLEEAIINFKDRRYKSCAMILFSLVDASLIRLQKRSPNAKRGHEVGRKAALEARKRSGVDEHDEWVALRLNYINLFSCLDIMFADGKDFKHQPDVINRNFLAHGMLQGKTTRTNCIQLFLLYYNVLDMLDLVYSKWPL